MPPISPCPSVEKLRLSLDPEEATLTLEERQAIEQHVEHCDRRLRGWKNC